MTDKAEVRCKVLFEEEKQKLARLRRELELLPNWLPGHALLGYLRQVEGVVGGLEERLEGKPVVAVVGPTGAGKSTLVNALSRRDGLAEVGIQRPTTRKITMVTRSLGDARQLLDRLGSDDLKVELDYASPHSEMILLDTPDTDSMESGEYRALLERVLGLADVLICVFDAANPKRQDNLSILANWVRLFRGDDVLLALNRCDRIEERQLLDDVVPDFKKHVSDARTWEKQFEVFCVSAREKLENPEWVEGEKPLHGYNQFSQLEARLQGLGTGTFFADRRLKRVIELRETVYQLVRESIEKNITGLRSASAKIKALRTAVGDSALASIASSASASRVNVTLWAELAQRWWGPVALHAVLMQKALSFWLPFRTINLLNPLRLLPTLLRSLRGLVWSGEENDLRMLLSENELMAKNLDERILIQRGWPEVAELLVGAGFDPKVRDAQHFTASGIRAGLSKQLWRKALEKCIVKKASDLSGGFFQFLLNFPVFVGCGFVGYYLVRNFSPDHFLPVNFFMHALFLLVLIWLVTGWILHFRVQASLKRISSDALELARKMSRDASEIGDLSEEGLERELDNLFQLEKL